MQLAAAAPRDTGGEEPAEEDHVADRQHEKAGRFVYRGPPGLDVQHRRRERDGDAEEEDEHAIVDPEAAERLVRPHLAAVDEHDLREIQQHPAREDGRVHVDDPGRAGSRRERGEVRPEAGEHDRHHHGHQAEVEGACGASRRGPRGTGGTRQGQICSRPSRSVSATTSMVTDESGEPRRAKAGDRT
ncbi:MAG: hypothetical protein H0X67_06205, partial [Acidobacteria bacterium]|nr:hypothetical protein [Acidobacteriota bacterium]